MVMSQTIVPTGQSPPAIARRPEADQRYLLEGISWPTYVTISNALADRSIPRLTYDRGNLEFMTPSPAHEMFKKRLAWLIETMALECGQAIETAGNMTFRREDLLRGFEFDDCFWIASEARVRGRTDYDPRTDPPPDLAIEIEVTRSAIDRLPLFAALQVREVWRFDGERLTVEVLASDGTYRRSNSPSFPWAPIDQLASLIEPNPGVDSLRRTLALRQWIDNHRKAAEE